LLIPYYEEHEGVKCGRNGFKMEEDEEDNY
jgi:hypothetical protein